MSDLRKTNLCGRVRDRLTDAVGRHVSLDTEWARKHVARCPRCRRRLARLGRVEMALSLLKSEPRPPDLLMHCNRAALRVVQRPLRHTPRAQRLRHARLQTSHLPVAARWASGVGRLAACAAVAVLLRAAALEQLHRTRQSTQRMARSYVARHAGEDIARQLFADQPGDSQI